MTSPPRAYSEIKGREKIKQSSYGEVDSSVDEYQDNSMPPDTSEGILPQEVYEQENFRATPMDAGRSTSPRHTLPNGPKTNSSLPPKKSSVHRKEPQPPLIRYVIYIVLGAVLAIGIGLYLIRGTNTLKKCTYDKFHQRYPVQDRKVWRTISINIENILNQRSTQPAVFLFVHQGGDEMSSLVRDIADETADCFGGKFELVEMSRDDFTSTETMEDHGYAIVKFKEKIKNGHVALIVNLSEIPAMAARALHTICDTHTPIAKNIVIFLTLVTPRSTGNPIENAENTLRNLWNSKLKSYELDPLITRVTDAVIALKS